MGPDLLTRPVSEVMTRAPRTIGPDALAADALYAMNAHERPVTALFVVAREGGVEREGGVGPDGGVVGILHIHDLLRSGLA